MQRTTVNWLIKPGVRQFHLAALMTTKLLSHDVGSNLFVKWSWMYCFNFLFIHGFRILLQFHPFLYGIKGIRDFKSTNFRFVLWLFVSMLCLAVIELSLHCWKEAIFEFQEVHEVQKLWTLAFYFVHSFDESNSLPQIFFVVHKALFSLKFITLFAHLPLAHDILIVRYTHCDVNWISVM